MLANVSEVYLCMERKELWMDVDMTYGVIAGGVAAIPPPPVSEAVIFPPVTFPPVMFPSCANAGVTIDVPAAEVTNNV
jgi:hypothetical protein